MSSFPARSWRGAGPVFAALALIAATTGGQDRVAAGSGPVAIQTRVGDEAWQTVTAITPRRGEPISLRVEPFPGAAIRWFQIIPEICTIYQNANHPWQENPYQWTGFDTIGYQRRELTKLRGSWRIEPFADQATLRAGTADSAAAGAALECPYYRPDVGSFWFQAEVTTQDGTVKATPGIDSRDYRGLLPSVFRVSVRGSDTYLGHLTSFFNVPGLFGSVPYQSRNFLGADCADVLMAAYHQWQGKHSTRDYNVAMVVDKFPGVVEFELRSGRPDRTIRWGKLVLPGDIIAVRYPGARGYQHIGALYGDANANGVLDRKDEVIHAGPRPLGISKLAKGGFDGHVVILRLLP